MEKAVVEGAGATGLAAVLGDYVPELRGKKYARTCKHRMLLKPGPHLQQCRSNIVEATGNFVACCFDNVAVLGNKVERCFDIVACVDRALFASVVSNARFPLSRAVC